MKCRHCQSDLTLCWLDLGSSPPSNAYLTHESLAQPELWYPLRLLLCQVCWLAQTEDFASAAQLFDTEYAYFSGYSSTWLDHCQRYVTGVLSRYPLGQDSLVIEIAANDGSLLQYFQAVGIPCLGVEPTAGTAASARAKGIPIWEDFFGTRLASALKVQGKRADLMIANNVLAHVPDINDFLAGFSLLLKPLGVATFEFPHLLQLIEGNQFDTVYHEHFSYLSLTSAERILASNGLAIFDVEELPTHGGSLRVYAGLAGGHSRQNRVDQVLEREHQQGLRSASYYGRFQACAEKVKNEFLEFLLGAKRSGRKVAAYGAAAKGNTLLNYAGVRRDLIPFVVDRNPAKQGKFLPGSRIPIVQECEFTKNQPDFVVILPWNLREEITAQLAYVRDWGGRFVTAVPQLKVE